MAVLIIYISSAIASKKKKLPGYLPPTALAHPFLECDRRSVCYIWVGTLVDFLSFICKASK